MCNPKVRLVQLLFCVLSVSIATGSRSDENQTPYQKAKMASLQKQAMELSEQATPQVLAYFASGPFRKALVKCCPSIAKESPAELLQRVLDEIDSAELLHNMQAVSTSNKTVTDTNVNFQLDKTFFYNIWQYALALNESVLNATDIAEEGLFGFKPFHGATSKIDNTTQPANFSEARERPIYAAMNIRGMAAGNPMFGPVSMVFDNRCCIRIQ
jgi:hypothetical protein